MSCSFYLIAAKLDAVIIPMQWPDIVINYKHTIKFHIKERLRNVCACFLERKKVRNRLKIGFSQEICNRCISISTKTNELGSNKTILLSDPVIPYDL